jgi:two-component system, LytTR family, sensor kinase
MPERSLPPWVVAPSVRRVMGLAISVAAILGLAVSAQTYLSMLGHGHSFTRILLWQLASWSFWAAAAPVVLRRGVDYSAHRHSSFGDHARLALLGVLLIVCHAIAAAQLTVWFQPFVPVQTDSFGGALIRQLPALFAIDVLVFVSLLIGGSAFFAHQRARHLELRESRLEAELARAQLHALRLEIEPHFLFNTLNAIAALIRLKDNPRALDMLLRLSEFMRGNLDRPREAFAPLVDEIEWVRQYVALQCTRFGDRLDIEYDLDANCDQVVVPALLLQPLVENALRHGAGRQSRHCTVIIGARMERRQVHLWVADDGGGLPEHFDIDAHAGTGLRNIRARMQHLYGTAATFRIASAAGRTTADLWLPAQHAEMAERATA